MQPVYRLCILSLVFLFLQISCGNAQNVPRKEAYLDIGSGNTKLIILVYPKEDGTPPVIETRRTAVLFKKGLTPERKFTAELEQQGLETLRQYAEYAKQIGAELKGGGATAAFREAEPAYAASLLQKWEQQTGWKLKVLTSEEEARAGYHAITLLLPKLSPGFIGFDMGGGSTQLMRETNGQFLVYGINWGAVNFSRHLAKTFPETRPEVNEAIASAKQELLKLADVKGWANAGPSTQLVAIGGVVYGFSRLFSLQDNILQEEQLLTLERELRNLTPAQVEDKYPSTKPYGAEMWSNTIALLSWMDILNVRSWRILSIEMGAGLSGLPFFQTPSKN